jgi:hypothetical protein
VTIPTMPTTEILLLLPEHWFAIPLDPAPRPADLTIEDWDQSTTSKLTDLLTQLGETGKAANISLAAAAIYDVGGEVTSTTVAAGYLHLPELTTLGDHDLTEIFNTSETRSHGAAHESQADHRTAGETSTVSPVELPVGPAVRRLRSIFAGDGLPSTIIIDFVIRPTDTPDTAVTLSFSAFGARPNAFIGLFEGLASGLHVSGPR